MRRCPECGEDLLEHMPFDPELVRRGLFRSSWVVLACGMCGHVERLLPQPQHASVHTPSIGRRQRRESSAPIAANV